MTDIAVDDTRLTDIAHARQLLPVANSVHALVEFLGHELYRLEGLGSELADEPDELGDRYRAIERATGLTELRDALDKIHDAIATATASCCAGTTPI